MPYPLQRNYREAFADLSPLQSMIRAARAGRDYANPRAFSDPQHKREQMRALFRADPGLRLAEMRQRYPDLAALDDERRQDTLGESETSCGICGFANPASGPDSTRCANCGGWIPPTNPDPGTRSSTRRSRLERRNTHSPVELRW
jgi:hypothetical protein